MVLINDNWEDVRDLEDVSKIIREYFSEDLADEMNNLISEHTDEEYYELEYQLNDKDDYISSLEDENDTLENRIEILEEKIEELEKIGSLFLAKIKRCKEHELSKSGRKM